MAHVLLAKIGDRVLRFPLPAGEHTVGTSDECDIRLPHPTVSRRHAMLRANADHVTITDLGSSNGSRLDGRAVTAETEVPPGGILRLGSVEARLERVAEADLEVGASITSPAPAEPDGVIADGRAPSTVGPAALESFSLNHLPRVADAMAQGESLVDVSQRAGAALYESLPCRRVDVERTDGGRTAVLFTAERRGGPFDAVVEVEVGNGIRIAVEFLTRTFADSYGPLVRATAGLLAAAGQSPSPATPPVRFPRPPRPEPPDPPSMVDEVNSIYHQAARIAPSKVSVLIRGESGTGKELLARYVHAASDRAKQPLVTLNCAALPRDLLESELFGIEHGVATGVEARQGRFEAAHGGTLFLDEIGDMSLETQARILRVLQEGEVYRVGGTRARPADVRVISATNRDLDTLLADDRFRSDLYHRIADWVVELPPLRRRRADIPNLAAHFLARACSERGVRVRGISRAALEVLMAYPWPGNVRELEKEMGRAALFLEDGDLLDTARLQPHITAAADQVPDDSLKAALERAERDHIQRVLDQCGHVVAEAAERLEIGVSTLYRRMKALGLE